MHYGETLQHDNVVFSVPGGGITFAAPDNGDAHGDAIREAWRGQGCQGPGEALGR